MAAGERRTADQRRDHVLEAMRSSSRDALTALLRALGDNDPIVREWAVEGLIRRKADRQESVRALIERLNQDRRADVRWYAARALGKLGLVDDSVTEALRVSLGDSDEYVRCFSAWSIGQLRLSGPDIVEDLRARLLALRRSSLEAQAIGVALARIHTDPGADGDNAPAQWSLFAHLPDMSQPPKELPKPKQALLEELKTTAEALEADRMGPLMAPRRTVQTTVRYVRSLAAKEKVVAARGESCQICNFRFRKRDGNHYYECHHIVPVHTGGPDDDWNLLVLCANHHRQLHYAAVDWPDGDKRPPAVVISDERYPIRWER